MGTDKGCTGLAELLIERIGGFPDGFALFACRIMVVPCLINLPPRARSDIVLNCPP